VFFLLVTVLEFFLERQDGPATASSLWDEDGACSGADVRRFLIGISHFAMTFLGAVAQRFLGGILAFLGIVAGLPLLILLGIFGA